MANSASGNGLTIAPVSGYEFTDITKQIQFASPATVAKPETGLALARKVYGEQTNQKNNLNFFTARSLHWIELLKWATGSQDMTEFLDYFNIVDATKAFVKIDMTPIMLGPFFVNTLVDSIAKNDTYACVEAIDDDSMDEKTQRKWDALFRLHDLDTIKQAHAATGVALEPPDAYVPDSELAAKVYFEMEDKLPMEIEYEKKAAATLLDNQYQRVMRPALLYDLVVHNAAAVKVERPPGKTRYLRRAFMVNVFYNYITTEDGKRQLSYIGDGYHLKVRDIRARFGKSPQNKDGLSEYQIFQLAKMSSTKGTGVGYRYIWQEQFSFYNLNRPWDDNSIYVIDFEYMINESEYYVGKTDSFGKENIAPKEGIPKPTSDKARVIASNSDKVYRAVYCPYADTILYWGPPDIVLFDQDNPARGIFSWSINIPQNTGEYMPSMFERAMEPIREYAIAKLKRKQAIAKLRPAGYRVDVETARNIDLGTGNTLTWEEVVRVSDQTGIEVWSSKGLNPNERLNPALSQAMPDNAMEKIMGLTQVMENCVNDIRRLMGISVFMDGAQVGDRTSGKLADAQSDSSTNVTAFLANAENELMEEALYKCLLVDWQEDLRKAPKGSARKTQLVNSKMRVSVKMKESEYERELLEQNIETWSKVVDAQGNPSLTPKDCFTIRNIQNSKLAELYLAKRVEENRDRAEKSKQSDVANNMQSQSASNAQTAANQQKLQQQEYQLKQQAEDAQMRRQERLALLNIVGTMTDTAITKGVDIPEAWKPVAAAMISHVVMPILAENSEVQQALGLSGPQNQGAQADTQQQTPPQPPPGPGPAQSPVQIAAAQQQNQPQQNS